MCDINKDLTILFLTSHSVVSAQKQASKGSGCVSATSGTMVIEQSCMPSSFIVEAGYRCIDGISFQHAPCILEITNFSCVRTGRNNVSMVVIVPLLQRLSVTSWMRQPSSRRYTRNIRLQHHGGIQQDDTNPGS